MGSRKLFPLITLIGVILTGFGCGNPAIYRIYTPGTENGQQQTTSSIAERRDEPLLLYKKGGIELYMKNVTIEDFQTIIKATDSESSDYRLPYFTYLKFIVKNSSGNTISAPFFNSYLADKQGNRYTPQTDADIEKHYTSIAYSNLDYNLLFSLYVTSPPRKGKGIYTIISRFPPGKDSFIPDTLSGEQIIPFKRTPEETRNFTLHLVLNGQNLEIPVDYHVIRSDYVK